MENDEIKTGETQDRRVFRGEKPINMKQQAFCHQYLSNGMNATIAYQSVYSGVSYSVAAANASELLTKTKIKAFLEELRADLKKKEYIERSFIVQTLLGLIKRCTEEGDHTNLNRALAELNKLMGFYEPTKSQVTGNISHEYQLLFPGVENQSGLISDSSQSQKIIDIESEEIDENED